MFTFIIILHALEFALEFGKHNIAVMIDCICLSHNKFCSVLFCSVSGVGSSPALATCETRQVLLAGVSGCLSRCSPVFAPHTVWPVSCELK